ncbi:MAG: UDP-glucose 4-epimerase family protein [Alphaproteobacteria bacterium]
MTDAQGAGVLVTGANGFVGRALCRQLHAEGTHVRAALRRPEAAPPGTAPFACGEIGPDTDWIGAFDGIGAVVHLAARVHVMRETKADPAAAFDAVNRDGTRRLAECAAAAGVGRFVFVSTIKVNGESTGAPGTPDAFRDADAPDPHGPYAASKWAAERALAEIAKTTGMAATVLRPPLVYGPGVKGNFRALLRLCRTGLPLPLGAIGNRRSMIHVDNLADAIRACLAHPAAAGETFLARDGEDLSTPELVRRLANALGRRARLIPVPVALLRLAGAATGRGRVVARLVDSLAVEDSGLRGRLGWRPPKTVDQGLAETADWFAAAREGAGHVA